MADSKIEWTERSDWNPLRGCTRKSPGCINCYAEVIAGRFSDEGQAFHGFAKRTRDGGRWTGKVELIESRLELPYRWKKPSIIFPNSTSDIFHESLPDSVIDRIVAVMAHTPHHTYQVLTKRADRMQQYWSALPMRQRDLGCDSSLDFVDLPLPNVWLGVSVEDQERADERREALRETPAAVKFVSYEPAIGSVDWNGWEFVNWFISGGESGRDARPSDPEWHRATRDFCIDHSIPYFFKQWGSCLPGNMDGEDEHGNPAYEIEDAAQPVDYDDLGRGKLVQAGGDFIRFNHKRTGRMLDGVQHDGFPA